jgi:hypothetical protein
MNALWLAKGAKHRPRSSTAYWGRCSGNQKMFGENVYGVHGVRVD